MAYKYTHFIKQNIAPKDAVRIAVYRDGKRAGSIPLGRMEQTKKEKLYSFGLISDAHMASYNATAQERFDNAISYFKAQGASFCCHCGDVSDYGLWYPISETDGTSYYSPEQYEAFRNISQKYDIPIYGCCGNHESYNGYNITGTYTDTYGSNPSLVVNNLEKLQEYTGNGLSFVKKHGDDVFIFVGQSVGNHPMTTDQLAWLDERLEENQNKRCFVFIHPYISAKDSGNPLGQHSLPLFEYWGATNTNTFISMMAHYKNTILFHGHSHVHFATQEQVKNAIYSDELGFRSVHVPSTANARKIVNGVLGGKDASYSLGYLVDVYDNYIVLNGMNMINKEAEPLGVYKIDTTLQPVT